MISIQTFDLFRIETCFLLSLLSSVPFSLLSLMSHVLYSLSHVFSPLSPFLYILCLLFSFPCPVLSALSRPQSPVSHPPFLVTCILSSNPYPLSPLSLDLWHYSTVPVLCSLSPVPSSVPSPVLCPLSRPLCPVSRLLSLVSRPYLFVTGKHSLSPLTIPCPLTPTSPMSVPCPMFSVPIPLFPFPVLPFPCSLTHISTVRSLSHILCPYSTIPFPYLLSPWIPSYVLRHLCPIPCPLTPAQFPFPFPLSPFHCPLSPVPCPLSPDPYPLSPVPHPLSPIPCPLSHVPYHLSPIPCPLSPIPCPLSPIPCPLSPIPYPMSPFPCLLFYVSYPVLPCLPSFVSIPRFSFPYPLYPFHCLLCLFCAIPVPHLKSPFSLSFVPCLFSPFFSPLSDYPRHICLFLVPCFCPSYLSLPLHPIPCSVYQFLFPRLLLPCPLSSNLLSPVPEPFVPFPCLSSLPMFPVLIHLDQSKSSLLKQNVLLRYQSFSVQH
jgi:hypothetical protein